jgi:ATP-dependent DNA helicase HFM1/MER3
MDDEAYYHFDDHEPRHATHFPLLQPQFKQPARPVPTRDRFRSTQYDDVVDDGAYGRSEGIQFDSFGE